MDITFITSTSYIDTVLPLLNELCKLNKIHLIVNFSKNTQKTSFINIKGIFKKNIIIRQGHQYLGDVINFLTEPDKFEISFVYWDSLKISNLNNWFFILQIKQLIKNAKLIHIQTLSFFWLLILKTKKTKKVIIDFHDPFEHSGIRKPIFLEFCKKKFIEMSNSIIIHNSHNKKDFEKHYKIKNDKVKVLSFGIIPLDKLYNNEENFKQNNNTVLFFGRISPYKGIEFLIAAAKIVRDIIPDLKVIIAGSGEFYFNNSDIRDDNTFSIINRYIPNDELANLICQSALIVCPYIDTTQSGVVMTAFAFQKPVIATNVGGLKEIVIAEKTGLLVPPKDPMRLAEAIIYLLNNPVKLEKMSRNIGKFCSEGEYAWENIAAKTFNVYKKALNRERQVL